MAFSLQGLYEPVSLPRMDTTAIDKLLDEAIARYQPGGEFGKPELALLGREKTKTLSKQKADLISRGMSKTTAGAGLGKKWEEEVGMPAKLRLEDVRTQRLLQALQAKAGFAERAQQTNLAAAQSEAQMRLQQQATESQFKASELGALAQAHAGAYGGGGGGGGRGAVDRAFWGSSIDSGGKISQAVAGGTGTHMGATAGAFGGSSGGQIGETGYMNGKLIWGEEQPLAKAQYGDTLIPGAGDDMPVEWKGATFTAGTPQYEAYKRWREGRLATKAPRATAQATRQGFRGAGYSGSW